MSTENLPVGERLDFWEYALGRVGSSFDIHYATDREFHAWMQAGWIAGLQVAGTASSRYDLVRTPRRIRNSDSEAYLCTVVAEGRMGLEQDGRTTILGRGDLAIVDNSRPYRFIGESSRRLALAKFPYSMIPLRQDRIGQLTGVRIPGDSGSGALISAMLCQIVDQLDSDDLAGNGRLATAMTDLIAAALATRLDLTGSLPSQTRQTALLHHICAFIEHHLDDPDLSPDIIAAAHHINPRYLRKLFQAQGHTVTGWIREQRLQRCRRDLVDPRLAGQSIAMIAARWGFLDIAHFTRTFRAAFGLPPAAYRHACGTLERSADPTPRTHGSEDRS
ncbi:helix-turn-helix domain-containing protein [Nocardia terpenica]|uniref:AraC-like ligand-binding domain-containing protein n=1 Tax=Nocardia terpenica TaxID=455432 RepID=UPI0018957C70|nr:helix-turn-helix domain-containing protein [Nocardia terpenica]MBF6064976.1 helix-turn-helix domain-containing protein [Nocardia terpenica]MBF6115248.1 helix-turn-helix domain-containing protein [Nocardia terpenica]MBF6122570.1 helix-turn-helix domain-containing protein [Nocardia terpenica]